MNNFREQLDIPDYTEYEKVLLSKPENQAFCPGCGHFWLRDYSYPVRHCPACGRVKTWADPKILETHEYQESNV